MTLLIDTKSPERGWEPFVQWLRDQGIDAHNTFAIEIDTDALTAEVTLAKLRRGERYVDPKTVEMARRTSSVRLSSLPPLHPQRNAA